MKIRLGFSTTNSIPSRMIRWFMDAPISHTYIRFYDETLGVSLVIHADWPGVVVVHGDIYDTNNHVIEEYEIDAPSLRPALRKSMRLLGKKYDYFAILGWAWVITFKRWAKRKLSNPIDDPKKLICVDFCIWLLRDAKLLDLKMGEFNPKEFLDWCRVHHEELGWKRHVSDKKET